MLETAATSFRHLQKLAEPSLGARFLAQLEPSRANAFARANLARRMGDLPAARDALALHTGASLHPWCAIPARLNSGDDHCLAPLVLIDNFLPAERMAALHRHACEREPLFRHALATSEDAEPEYDPNRRETLLDYGFTQERQHMLSFVEDNAGLLCELLGLAPISVARHEIKLSNHVDGGFFKAHSDNHASCAEAGRVITWLYYFGEPEPRFRGGELYLLDGNPQLQQLSPAWFSTVVPRANRFVAFPSWFFHAVAPTTLSGGSFASGRMAVSGHLRKAADAARGWWEAA